MPPQPPDIIGPTCRAAGAVADWHGACRGPWPHSPSLDRCFCHTPGAFLPLSRWAKVRRTQNPQCALAWFVARALAAPLVHAGVTLGQGASGARSLNLDEILHPTTGIVHAGWIHSAVVCDKNVSRWCRLQWRESRCIVQSMKTTTKKAVHGAGELVRFTNPLLTACLRSINGQKARVTTLDAGAVTCKRCLARMGVAAVLDAR